MTAANRSGPAATRPRSHRLIGIEGLRGAAALLVLFRHVAQYTTDPAETGWLGRLSEWSTHGLTLFFVLSGFLLYRPFAAAILPGDGLPSLRGYALNRFLRIYPNYVVIFVLACLLFDTASLPTQPGAGNEGSVGRLTDPAAVASNLLLVQTYVPSHVLTGIAPAWSLTAEIGFYVTLPALAVAAAALSSRRLSPGVAAIGAPLSLIALGWGASVTTAVAQRGLTEVEAARASWGPTWTAVWDRSFLTQADLFGYGMLVAVLAVVVQRRRERRPGDAAPSWSRVFVMVALGLLVLLPVLGLGERYGTKVMGLVAASFLAGVVMPSRHRGQHGNLLARCLEWSPIRYLGLISYSIYLWHVPVILGLDRYSLTFGDDAAGLFLTTALTVVTVVGLSTVTYLLVERPALTRRAPWRRGGKGDPPIAPRRPSDRPITGACLPGSSGALGR